VSLSLLPRIELFANNIYLSAQIAMLRLILAAVGIGGLATGHPLYRPSVIFNDKPTIMNGPALVLCALTMIDSIFPLAHHRSETGSFNRRNSQ